MSVAEIDAPIPAEEAEHQGPMSLRALADHVAEKLPAGYRVEVLGGEVVASPIPVNKHMYQVRPQLPDGLTTFYPVGVGFNGDDDELAVPDLVVLPIEATEEEIHRNPPDTIEFTLEVVSKGNALRDLRAKPITYAKMMIPIYLIVDPLNGSLILHSDPRDGEYQAVHRMAFGETVKLPDPLGGIEINTESFTKYSKPKSQSR